MRKDKEIKDWKRIYDELTDQDKQSEARRKKERDERLEAKVEDTGL